MYLLDTNILIYHFNNDIPDYSSKKVNKIFQEYFKISVITKMEFLGFKNHTNKSFIKAKKFINYSRVINLNDKIVDLVIEIRRKYNIKLPDAVIAATAMNESLILATRNVKDFESLNLKLYNPFNE